MVHMHPGNSFPQICVVSEIHSVEICDNAQDYRQRVDVSNQLCLLMSKWSLSQRGILAAISRTAIPSAAIVAAPLLNSGGP